MTIYVAGGKQVKVKIVEKTKKSGKKPLSNKKETKKDVNETAYPFPHNQKEIKDRFIAIFNSSGVSLEQIRDIFDDAMREYQKQKQPSPYFEQ